MSKAKMILAVTALGLVTVASSAVAGNPKSSSSISLVLVSSARTATTAAADPTYGSQVTFAVSTTATDRPYVLVNCYQNGTWVYAGQAGFWAGALFGQNFTLASTSWTSGAANCTARLGALNADGTRFRELASTSFNVGA